MEPILPFSKNELTPTVLSRVKPSKNITSLREPAVFGAPRLATAIAESTMYPKPKSNAAKFFKGPTLPSNAAAVFARPPPNSPNRPPTNAELAQMRAELERQKQARNRLVKLRRLQRNLPMQTSPIIGKMRAPSPNTENKYPNGSSGISGGKRKTLRKHKGKKAKKTNKRRH